MHFRVHHLVVLAYIGAGIFFAWDRGYLNEPILKTIGSAFLAILFWWLLLLGVNLHIQ